MTSGPLAGYRIIELAGIGPGPYCGRLFADLGADVIVIERPGFRAPMIDLRGKKSVVLDLRKEGAAEVLLKLVETADALIEGNRPGVTERLGVGPEECHKRNPKLIYGRMTGWGQDGPWSQMAGHDINYISITGALNAMGVDGDVPPPPLNLVGDYGGGSMFLALGVVSAMLQAQKTGKGDVIDAAIIDGVQSMSGILYSLTTLGQWTTKRQSNMLDGGAPYYRCYKTSDGKFMAVGCIEPQFFAEMLEKLDLSPDAYGGQNDRDKWPAQHRLLEETYATRTRDQWAEIFDKSDACVTPVLDYLEAKDHPQNKARQALVENAGYLHPNLAPRLGAKTTVEDLAIADKAGATRTTLGDAGFSEQEINDFLSHEIVSES